MTSLARKSVLVVDDELAIRRGVQQRFTDEGAEVEVADSVGAAREKLEKATFDLIVLDHRLPDGTGLGLLERLRSQQVPSAVLMMTAYASPEDAVRAMKAGAIDYMTKPFDLDEMVLVAGRALENEELRRELARRRSQERDQGSLSGLIGKSPALDELREFVQQVAESGAPTVLITGESGTGKNLVAQALHYAGPNADRPFLNITCTALPEPLLESELFGHEKGAFTDAKAQKRGLIEEADGGTLFLDEIGDLPKTLQAKLLRFLEDRRFRRVGGLKDLSVDVRVVAATNCDLQAAIEEGRFRSDLYYRLNVIPVEIPPLREHCEDVPILVNHFCEHYAREFRRPARHFDAESMACLQAHPWPGNVRELKNCVERAVLLGRADQLGLHDLPRELRTTASHQEVVGHGGLLLPSEGVVFDELVRSLLDQALERTGGNKSRAAELLGIHRDNVRYWVKKYGLERWVRTKADAEAEDGEARDGDAQDGKSEPAGKESGTA